MNVCIVTLVARQPVLDHVMSIHKLMAEARKHPGAEVSYLPIHGQANTPRARNIGVQKALESGADQIVFIDDDIGFEFEAFQQLFEDMSKDVVAGMPQRRADDLSEVMFCGTFDPEPKVDGPYGSGFAATAFMRISRRVFEEMPATPFQHASLRSESNLEGFTRDWFDYRVGPTPSGEEIGYNGEDYEFCRKCKEMGVEVWLNPSIRLRHWHMVPLEACYGDRLD